MKLLKKILVVGVVAAGAVTFFAAPAAAQAPALTHKLVSEIYVVLTVPAIMATT